MNDIERIALPPEVLRQPHVEATESGEQEMAGETTADTTGQVEDTEPTDQPRFTLDGFPVQPAPRPAAPAQEVEQDTLEEQMDTGEEQMDTGEPLTVPVIDKSSLDVLNDIKNNQETAAAALSQSAAAQAVIVPPVNVTVPPELVTLFNNQLQHAMNGLAQQMTANVESIIRGVISGLPAQEADAVKKNPWLIPALDVILGVTAVGIFIFIVVAAVGFNNALAKQYLGAAGMVALALFKQSPTAPASAPSKGA